MTQGPYTSEGAGGYPPAQPPAGWYPDPQDQERTRYWDGSAWTEHTGPAASGAPARPALENPGQGYGTPAYGGGAGYGGPYGTAGAPQAPRYGAPAAQRTNGFAIASLVLGIVWVYWIGSILALVFGYVALAQIKRSGGTLGGRGLAIAGTVLGWIGVGVLMLLVLLILLSPEFQQGFQEGLEQ